MKPSQIIRVRGTAFCSCGWEEITPDKRTAREAAKRHVWRTGHGIES